MELLTVRDLALSYEAKTVLEHVSFSVSRGDFLCVVGENGSGKSSLIKAILGLIPLDAGTIERAESVRAGKIGYLAQSFAIPPRFPATVYEVVLSGFQAKPGAACFYSAEQRRAAKSALERLSLSEFASARAATLSGGQRQRMLLARALCAAENLLVLDEPVAGLDPLVTHELYHLLRALNREGMTIVMVSHDLSGALGFADHVLHLQKTALFFGSTGEYLKTPLGRRFLSPGKKEADA